MLINGEWIESKEKLEVRNPYNGDLIDYINITQPDQVTIACEHAKQFQSKLTSYERSKILANTADDIEKQAEIYQKSIVLESGLSLKDAKKEVKRAVTLLKVCSEEAKRINGESIYTDITEGSSKNLAITIREPIGLVCAITPFNRPLNQIVVKLGPAIAANNSIILKPSEKTPLTAIKFVKTLIDNGLPQKMVSIVTGKPDIIGDLLIKNPHIDMITFTGSAVIGEHIAMTAGMIKTTFELGDSGALIVMNDAKVEKAIKVAVAGAFATSGQSCRGIKRIYVDEKIKHSFINQFVEKTKQLKVGDPMDPETDIGVLINEESAIAIQKRIDQAVEKGAKIELGGIRKNSQILPTILSNVPQDADIVQKETFGPCAPIISFSTLKEVIDLTNDTPYGLQTGIFTNSISDAMYAAKRLKVGAVAINNGPQFDSPNIPFGGVKKSGLGREGVKYAINEMTTVKTIIL